METDKNHLVRGLGLTAAISGASRYDSRKSNSQPLSPVSRAQSLMLNDPGAHAPGYTLSPALAGWLRTTTDVVTLIEPTESCREGNQAVDGLLYRFGIGLESSVFGL